MTMTMRESATRHMAAGVMDLDELSRLVQLDTGTAPNRKALSDCRSYFRQHGEGWVEVRREQAREAGRKWYAENPDAVREKCKRWRETYPAKSLLRQCVNGAKRRGLDCAITADYIEAMLAPMVCSATGLPLTWEHGGSTRANPWAPSIDRLDCSKGYVPGNVRVVCWAFNQMRGEFPDEVVMTLAKALAARAP